MKPKDRSTIYHFLKSGVRVGDLGVEGVEVDEWTGEDVRVVRDLGGILLGSEDGVRDTLDNWVTLNLTSLDGEGVGGETGVDGDKLALDINGRGNSTIGGDGELWESLDGESWVGGWARGDEVGGDRVDAVESQGGVVGTGPSGTLHDGGSEPSLVSSLGGEDGTGNGNVSWVLDGGSGT